MGCVKEFLVYNALRLLLLVGSLVVVIGIWSLLSDRVNLVWALVISLLLSGIASWFLLKRPREALARKLEERAGLASAAFEARKAREDND